MIRLQTRGVAVSLVLFAGACGGPDDEGPAGHAQAAAKGAVRLDEHRTFAAPIVAGNLQVWPIVSDAPLDLGDFATLHEAQEAGVSSIRERSDGADVNTLEIENRGDRPILVCAGTLVRGGKQDRQIGRDLVVAAGSTVPVEAYCVEQERWSGDSAEFVACAIVAPHAVRAPAQYGGDQGEVWKQVDAVNSVSGADSATGSLFATVDREAAADESVAHGSAGLEESVRAGFDALGREDVCVVGFAYAIDGRPVTIRTFAHPKLLASQLPAFVSSMCLEAELAGLERGSGEPRRATLDDVLALVRATEAAAEEVVPTAAANVIRSRRSDEAAASACQLRALGYLGGTVTEDWSVR